MINSTFNPDLPLRYVMYGRMSDEEQNPRSPDQQFDDINRTKTRQRRDNWVNAITYRDDAISGRYHRKRPGFREMLDDIRSGLVKTDLILVDTLERFARLEDLPAIREELRKNHGVLVLTSDTGFVDPTTNVGRMYGAMEAMRASSAAHQKAHDVLRGKIDVVEMKRWPGGPPPCGYRLVARTETITRRNGKTLENVYHVLDPDPATTEIPRKVYQIAYDHGWGRCRITKLLNSDADFVGTFGKISDSLVGSIMTSTTYMGLFRFNYRATDIQDDCKISKKKDPDEVIYIADFCTGIVNADIVKKVHADCKKRSEQSLKKRAVNKVNDGKQIQPTSNGLILVYPLSGLARCGKCGAAMQPTKSGTSGKDGKRYHYYRCPIARDGRCSNKIYLPGDWLWEVVIARLREVLFPLSEHGENDCPAWVSELIAEVRCGLETRLERDPDRRPMLENESKDIDSKVDGWTETLSKKDLSSLVRNQIEQQLNLALERKQKIGVELEMRANAIQHVSKVLDVNMVIDRLGYLAQVLAGGNASDMNEQLAKQIESLAVHPDGTVVMRTNRLGVFEGASEMLAGSGELSTKQDSEPGDYTICPRALSRRRTTGPAETSKLAKPSGVIERMVALPDKWVDEAIFSMPTENSFAKKHGEEVFLRRQAGKLSFVKLADEFGVTPPTCRAALKYYLETHPAVTDGVKLRPGGKRPAKFDVSMFGGETRALWEVGWSKLKLAKKFACSTSTIDKALVWAYKQDGLPVPARTDTKGAKITAARAALDGGQSLDEIAKMLKVSDVTAREYLRESFAAEDKPMPDLRSRRCKR